MKTIVSAIVLAVFVFAAHASAQTVIISPRKVTYKRPKPMSEYKTTFTVTYPKVKASSPALSKKIENTISYSKVLDLNVQEEITEYQWLEEADYEINYNARGILVITLSMNGTGAYPDGSSKTIAIDLKTGSRLRPADVFTNLTGLTAMIRKAQRDEVVKALKESNEDPENGDADSATLFAGKNFSAKDLDEFAVSGKGVTFIYDYGFPHAIQALEPDGRYSFTWDQLRRYIKRGGLLSKFI